MYYALWCCGVLFCVFLCCILLPSCAMLSLVMLRLTQYAILCVAKFYFHEHVPIRSSNYRVLCQQLLCLLPPMPRRIRFNYRDYRFSLKAGQDVEFPSPQTCLCRGRAFGAQPARHRATQGIGAIVPQEVQSVEERRQFSANPTCLFPVAADTGLNICSEMAVTAWLPSRTCS